MAASTSGAGGAAANLTPAQEKVRSIVRNIKDAMRDAPYFELDGQNLVRLDQVMLRGEEKLDDDDLARDVLRSLYGTRFCADFWCRNEAIDNAQALARLFNLMNPGPNGKRRHPSDPGDGQMKEDQTISDANYTHLAPKQVYNLVRKQFKHPPARGKVKISKVTFYPRECPGAPGCYELTWTCIGAATEKVSITKRIAEGHDDPPHPLVGSTPPPAAS